MHISPLVCPNAGHDSVVARGRREPDPRLDTSIQLDGKPVTVPQARSTSMFSGV